MPWTVLQRRLVSLVILLVAAVGVWLWPIVAPAAGGDGLLHVVFFDIGQGDSIFIESPTGTQVLVDGGPDSTVLRRLAKYMSYFDRTIDMIVPTHPDSDHVSGLIDVLDRYQVDHILMTENTSDTATFKRLQDAIAEEGAPITTARTNEVFALGGGVTLRVLSPAINPSGWDTNRSSIVLQLQYGSSTVMLTGDAPAAIEQQLVSVFGDELKSSVLKPGHHGSRTATSEAFVQAVDPTYAVISAGAHNRYGHPTQEVMDRLWAHHVTVYSTIDDGSVEFVSDGHTIAPAKDYPLAHTVGGK